MSGVRTFFAYFFVGALSLVVLGFFIEAWNLDLSIPFAYEGDAIFGSAMIKTLIDTGWYLTNPYLGAPDKYSMFDFPMSEGFHFFLLRIISFFSSNYATVLNSFFLLTFPLAAMSALFVSRRMGLKYPLAVAVSILFALAPYHFFRFESHLFLSSYWVIPLVTWLAILIADNKLFTNDQALNFWDKKWVRWTIYSLLCVLIGSSGVYYAFFTVFFLLIAGAVSFFNSKKITPLKYVAIFALLISATVAVNILPSLIYIVKNGPNHEVGVRSPAESEAYGLKIIGMLIPSEHNRTKSLAKMGEHYNQLTLRKSENGNLGIIGSLGFIILLAMLLPKKNPFPNKNIYFLSRLNIFALLLGTISGLGALFAYTISPMIRCYDRISIFIAFFSLTAFFLTTQHITNKFSDNYRQILMILMAIFLLVMGTYDQVPNQIAQQAWKPRLNNNFQNDKDFIAKIENILPNNSMVFQLPYMGFPEDIPIYKMVDYEHFKAYLHSHHLLWSYGSMRGRSTATQQEYLAQLPIPILLKKLAYLNFTGLYLNRNGYADHGQRIEAELTSILHAPPIVSNDANLSFYDVREYIKNFKNSESTREWQEHIAQMKLAFNFHSDWGKGCYGIEPGAHRWCKNKTILYVTNDTSQPLRAKIQFSAGNSYKEADLWIKANRILNAKIKINSQDVFFSQTIAVPPGRHKIFFNTNAERVVAPGDPRELYFYLKNFSLIPLI